MGSVKPELVIGLGNYKFKAYFEGALGLRLGFSLGREVSAKLGPLGAGIRIEGTPFESTVPLGARGMMTKTLSRPPRRKNAGPVYFGPEEAPLPEQLKYIEGDITPYFNMVTNRFEAPDNMVPVPR